MLRFMYILNFYRESNSKACVAIGKYPVRNSSKPRSRPFKEGNEISTIVLYFPNQKPRPKQQNRERKEKSLRLPANAPMSSSVIFSPS